jgi:predicted nucleic acid-binding protein
MNFSKHLGGERVTNLVIDTWVWVKAQNLEAPECGELLYKLTRLCKNKILCDDMGEIGDEYWKHMKGVYAQLFKRICQMGKVVHRGRMKLNISGFDPSDIKFLEVALACPGAFVVSGDSDFLSLREQIAKGRSPSPLLKNIKILTPSEVLSGDYLES